MPLPDGTLTAEEQSLADADKVAADAAIAAKANGNGDSHTTETADEKIAREASEAAATAETAIKVATPDPNIVALNAKIAEQTKLLNTLIEKSDVKAAENEWTIEKLEAAEFKCHSGEY